MLTLRAKYAIKALLHLGLHADQGPVQARLISESENIPYKFLEVILLQLRNRGLIKSKVGKGGGHELAKTLKQIDLLTVVRTIDGPVAPLPCLSHTAYVRCDDCQDEATCGVRQLLMKAHELQVEELSKTTLADAMPSSSAGRRPKTAKRRSPSRGSDR